MFIFISPNNETFEQLPNPWKNGDTTICGLTFENCRDFGWTIQEKQDDMEILYSKYKIHDNLEKMEKWNDIWTAVVASGFEQFWNDCTYLSNKDERFNSFCEQIKIAFPDLDFDEILRKSFY